MTRIDTIAQALHAECEEDIRRREAAFPGGAYTQHGLDAHRATAERIDAALGPDEGLTCGYTSAAPDLSRDAEVARLKALEVGHTTYHGDPCRFDWCWYLHVMQWPDRFALQALTTPAEDAR